MTKKVTTRRVLYQIIVLCLAIPARGAEPNLGSILEGLRGEHLVLVDLRALLYFPPAPVIRNSLHDAFDHFGSKRERQEVAAVLVEIGDDDPRYFNYLEGFARTAIEDSAPFFMVFDDSGHASRQGRNVGFEQWCKDRGADPSEIARLQYAEYPRDVDLLGRTRDPRAAALLLEGLGSANPYVVAKAALGLGLLGRTDAVPLLAKACEKFTKDGSAFAAQAFAEFQTPLAEQYLNHFEADWRMRLKYHKEAAQRREGYAKKAAARRSGG